jgi:tRNA A37 N6-isopentenylltransferase MiaA
LNGEIISADSVQLWKETRIGSNRPTDAQLKMIPHYLVAAKSLGGHFNAVDFCTEARELTKVFHIIE